MYSKAVMEHFRNPRNIGRIKNPSGRGKAGNILCGDVMVLYIKIGKNEKGQKIIKDVKFETFGCAVAMAVSSMLTTMVKGKTLEEAMEITKDDILKKLGKVPAIKVHCSVLGADALSEAIYDYYKRNGSSIPEELEEKHKRIQETLETAEEKQKEYINLDYKKG